MRSVWALAALPAVFLCTIQPGTPPPVGGAAVTPIGAAAAGGATPTDYRGCGPDARRETGLQGQVPKADQDSGRSRAGYRCNLRELGQNDIGHRGANTQLAWYKDCAYVSIIGTREFFPNTADPVEGLAVLDASDPRHPQFVQNMRSPVGRNQHEGVEVNEKRGMLVAQIGGISARYMEIYDVSKDCRHPVLRARYDAGSPFYHGLKISDDGNTIYASDGIGRGSAGRKVLDVIDVKDISNPRLLERWGPLDEVPPKSYIVHDLDLSQDGTRAYLGASPPSTALGGLGFYGAGAGRTGPTVVTLDTTDIKERRENPDLRVISQVDTPNFGHTVQRARINGKRYIVASGESPFASGLNCPWAWGHVIDMSDERNPRVVSDLRLEVNLTNNCSRANADNVTYSIHYAGVDDEQNTTKVFYTYYGGGLRVFDVRDPAHPREIAYYHPRPEPSTILQPLAGTFGGDGQTPAWDSATSVVRYRPETGQIWIATIGGGLHVLELTGAYACEPARARARGRRLGRARLARTRARQRATLPTRPNADGGPVRRGVDRYCTTDRHTLRLAYPTKRLTRRLSRHGRRRVRRRALVALSDSPFASVRGIAPGDSVRKLRRRLRGERRIRTSGSVWYIARGSRSRLVFRTARSRVRAVGIADRRLTATRSGARRFLRSWNLRR